MAGENIPRTLKNATVLISDTNGTGNVTLTAEDGDITITFPRRHEHVPDRGDIGTLVDSSVEPITYSMTVQMREWTTSLTSIAEAVLGQKSGWVYTKVTVGSGTYNGKTATLSDAAATVKLFQCRITFTNPASGGTDEIIYLLDSVPTSLRFSEGMPNKFTLEAESFQTTANFFTNVGS